MPAIIWRHPNLKVLKEMNENTTEPTIYAIGNPWQKKVYKKMSGDLEANPEIRSFGQSSNGTSYKHLLTIEQSKFNFITDKILSATKERFSKHKAGDLHRILTNTAASQPYCFNLIIYLQQHPSLADKLFSDLFGKQVKVQHLEPEFTPNLCDNIKGFERATDESIGDQNLKLGSGTDSDIAVFYTYDNNEKKGILLIEFKFIEAEFSVCSSYSGSSKKKNETEEEKVERIKKRKRVQSICNSEKFFTEMVEVKNTLCGYNKYFNWQLTEKSKAIDGKKIKTVPSCPFRFGLNQLWRNMLLAEQVATARQCDEFGFWVFSPRENDNYLWKKEETEKQFREILTNQGKEHFQKIYLETIFDKLQTIITERDDKLWLTAMETKYRIS
ncbi:MAG: hypothetical protein ABI402_07675 [Ferruginibacter sp.]